MSRFHVSIVIPRQLRDLPAFKNASRPIQDRMAQFVWIVLCSGALTKRRQISSQEFAHWGLKRYASQFRKQLSSIVECDERYSHRHPKYKKCLSFRFNKQICQNDFEAYEPQAVPIQNLCKKPMPRRLAQLITKDLDLPVHEQLAQCLQRFTLQVDELLPVLDGMSLVKREKAKVRIDQWLCSGFYFVRGTTRRLCFIR